MFLVLVHQINHLPLALLCAGIGRASSSHHLAPLAYTHINSISNETKPLYKPKSSHNDEDDEVM